MNRARFDNRAKWLHQDSIRAKAQLPIDMPREEFWRTKVKTKEDIVTFY